MNVSKFSVKHTPVLTMILIALALFGVFSVSSMNLEFIPDMNLPQIFVIAIYPGASAEDVEKTIIDVMEDNFVTLPDFRGMDSQAMNSAAMITITFSDGVDVYDQLDEVRNRISEMEDQLPAGLQGTPTALVGGASMLPVASFAVSGGTDLGAITEYIENDLKPQLTQISGVSSITVSGGVYPEIDVRLRLDDLDSKGISPLTVYQLLSYSNVSMPLGTSEAGGRSIDLRFDGSFQDVEEIRSLPVGASDDGTIIRLSDVADVDLVYDSDDYTVTSMGKDIVLVDVSKRSDGNTVQITDSIKRILADEERESNGALSFSMISDDSQIVTSSLKNVIESGIMGVIIAILVIFVFLNDLRATFIIGLSIPLSCFFTFIVMKIAGISVNLMSISGIVVALGSIVDASIVVLDQVYRFYQQEKDGKALYSVTQSIYHGTGIVDKSVIGSNLTTVVVFIPLAMLSGMVGQILHDVSITFMFAIFSSLLVAIVFVPYLMKKILREDGSRKPKKELLFVRGINRLEHLYKSALGSCLEHTPFFIIIAFLIFGVTVYSLTQLGFAFIPSTDNNDFYISIELPYGYTSEQTEKVMQEAERILVENVPELRTDVVFSGKSIEVFSFSATKNQGGIHAVLVPVAERDRDIHDIILDMQYRLSAAIPDAKINVKNGGFDYLVGYISGGGGYGLTLVGNDSETLYREADRIRNFLLTDPEVISASVNSSYDARTSVIDASYEYMSSLGIPAYEAAMSSAILFNGVDAGTFHDSTTNERYSINLTSDASERPVDEALLSSLKIKTQAGSTVSFAQIADLTEEQTLSSINHSDRAQTITINAQLTGESTSGVTRRVDEYLKANPLEDGITTKAGGIGELMAESMGPIMRALIIALFLVYMVIVLIYERFDQPFMIMLTVPFCVIGVVVSLAVFGSSMNMVSIMGIISLTGMVVNNGIIMVDYINQLERRDRLDAAAAASIEVDDADKVLIGFMPFDDEISHLKDNVREGTSSRLRPILMSSLTTILGVIPMAIATGEGAEVYAPLGQVIMGGLTTSTFITLFLMPVLYFVLERHRIRKFMRRKGLEVK